MPYREKTLEEDTRRRLKGAGVRAKKGLGQNFLTDENIRDCIIEAAALTPADTVLEVGPGLGVLTERLAALAGRVVAVELDEVLADRLSSRLSKYGNLQVLKADILHLDVEKVLGAGRDYKVVANIPYYITSPILRYFTRNKLKPSLMVIMMQKEVAQDVAAAPGNWTFLSASMQLFSRAEIVCKVPAASFHPVPKVDSAVVKFTMFKQPAIGIEDIDTFLEFLHAGFAAPRKKLRNSLALGLKIGPEEAEAMLQKSGIDSQRRPGTLTLDEWGSLFYAAGEEQC